MSEPREQRSAALTAEALAILRSGRPGSGPDGVAKLQQAMLLGSGEAAGTLAHFAAAGLGQEANWDQSLDLLQRAAELGWAPALAELRLLARGVGDTPAALRAAADIRARVAGRELQRVSEAPRINTISRFMSAEECAWLIAAARDRLAPAAVYGRDQAGSEVSRFRTNSAADFGLLDMSVPLTVLRHRIANTLGLPAAHFEQPTVLHYAPGQEFQPHCDFLDVRFPGPAADVQARGQRIVTFLVYLNEDFEGGETHFPRIDYRFKGKTGDAIAFANVDAKSQPDFASRHAGLAPTSGEKWLLSQWIRDRAQA